MTDWLVKYDGTCSRCGIALVKGTPAVWDRRTKSIHCIECPVVGGGAVATDDVLDQPEPFEPGTAGASARREYERRSLRREGRIRVRFGDRVGGFLLKLVDEPSSTRAWAIGAAGEEKLARELLNVSGIRILHDRRVPGSRGNIDHVIVAPAGVFVVDAKRYEGLIQVKNRGSILRPDPGLFVGRRDCTKLADGLAWQVDAVLQALDSAGFDPMPSLTSVLCFVDGEWPWIGSPHEFRGVRLESQRSIRKLIGTPALLDPPVIERIASELGARLPSK